MSDLVLIVQPSNGFKIYIHYQIQITTITADINV